MSKTRWGSAPRRIALIQSELEYLHYPITDLSAALSDHANWRIDRFTDVNVDSLFPNASEFDCIVFAENAIDQSVKTLDVLARHGLPDVSMLVLSHNLPDIAYPFITRLTGVTFEDADLSTHRARVAANRSSYDEIILNWPYQLPVDAAGMTTIAGSVTHLMRVDPDASRARPVLEVETARGRLPVVVRSSSRLTARYAVVTMRLQASVEAHARLLANLVEFCAGGRPDIVAVGRLDDKVVPLLVRKLRFIGFNTIEGQIAGETLPFDRWPIVGSRQVIVSGVLPIADILSSSSTREWLRRGGVVAEVLPSDQLALHHGTSDFHWLAQRWAAWYQLTPAWLWCGGTSTDGRSHRGSIFKTRSVVRVLEAIRDAESGVDPAQLGLSDGKEHRDEIRSFVTRRLLANGSADDIISTSAAVHDIDRIVGEVLDDRQRLRLRSWMRHAFEAAELSDRLDIARTLGDGDLLARALRDVPTSCVSPAVLNRIRLAAVACGMQVELPDESDLDDLDRSHLLSGEYLLAWARWMTAFQQSSEYPEGLDRAITTLLKYGSFDALLGNDPSPDDRHDPEIEPLCLETLALLALFRLPTPRVHPFKLQQGSVHPSMLEAVQREAQSARDSANELRLQLVFTKRDRAALNLARHAAGVVCVALGLGVFVLATRILTLANIAIAAGVGALAFAICMLACQRVALAPSWIKAMVTRMKGGWMGLIEWLAEFLGRDAS